MTASPRRRPTHDSDVERLRRLRVQLGMTQRELASEFGVTGAAIALWENGDRAISGSVLRLMDLYEAELTPMARPRVARTSGIIARAAFHARRTSTGFESLAWLYLSRVVANGRPDSVASRVRMAAVRRYVASFGELKGLAMKVGQMFGYMSFLFPEEYATQLARLTSSARPQSVLYVASTMLAELGALPTELFREWNPTPIAVASIGQVHEAVTKAGERVAVKVQHARIVDAIQSDLKHVAMLDRVYSLIFRGQTPGVFHEEMHARVLDECDYRLEATNQEDFGAIVRGRSDIAVPRVFRSLSSQQVLTTEHIAGRTLDEMASASAVERNAAARSIWRFFWESALRHGLYHTDPNPGNFVFGDGVVTVLDFGRVQRLSPDFLVLWKQLFRAMLERDRGSVARIFDEMKSLADPQKYDLDNGYRSLLACFLPVATEEQPFRFTPEFVRAGWRAFILENVNLSVIDFTADMVFLHQIQFGLSAIMTILRAEVSCREIFLDLLYEPGEARPPAFTRGELALLGLTAGCANG